MVHELIIQKRKHAHTEYTQNAHKNKHKPNNARTPTKQSTNTNKTNTNEHQTHANAHQTNTRNNQGLRTNNGFRGAWKVLTSRRKVS